jgi:ABC-2 type transport system ATP-binding protein
MGENIVKEMNENTSSEIEVLSFDKVSKTFGTLRANNNISFQVKEGEILGLLGPNGAGKSTLLRQVVGLVHIEQGAIKLLAAEGKVPVAQIKEKIGYVSGELNLPMYMKVSDYFKFLENVYGRHIRNNYIEYANALQLDGSKKIKNLSTGNKQKVAIIAALVHDPKVIILDEPTAGLDAEIREKFVNLILKLRGEGRIILISSHTFGDIEMLCDRICILKKGSIVKNELLKDINIDFEIYKVNFASNNYANEMRDFPFPHRLIGKTAEVKIPIGGFTDFLTAINKIDYVDFVKKDMNLREYFLSFFEEGLGD